jgi:hypothetical protein
MRLSAHIGLAVLLSAICLAFSPGWLAAQSSNGATPRSAALAKQRTAAISEQYYIEFRAAEVGLYGHTYLIYGKVGGQPNYADHHAQGGYPGMSVGHVIPVPSNTAWEPSVLTLPVASSYRKMLTAQQYQRVVAAVKARSAYWHVVTNNCNHFLGTVAGAAGLRVPDSFQFAYSFVPALRSLNENGGS